MTRTWCCAVSGMTRPKLKLLREGDVAWGAGRIELTNTGARNLWLETRRATEPGRGGTRQFSIQTARGDDEKCGRGTNAEAKSFSRAGVSMLEAGFVASPVLLSASDVRKAVRGAGIGETRQS